MFGRGAPTRHRLARAALVPVVGAVAAALAASPAAAQTQGNLPFARGQLVSRSGSTLDLQGGNGDRKVIVTGSTKYQQTKTADASAVTVGACIRVTGTGGASKGIAATTVALSPAAANCNRLGGANGFAGRFRNRNGANGNGNGNGNGTFNPNGNPNGNGDRRGFPADFGTVAGKVTKVSGDNIVVKGMVLQAPTKPNARPKTTTKSVKVTLSGSTRVDQTVAATADVLAVGSCVTAAGTADSVGTVTANTVTVSQPVNGACTGGFGFGGGRRDGFPGGGPGATAPNGNTGTA